MVEKFMGEFLNEKPFEHIGSYGVRFIADHCDFRNGVNVLVPTGLSAEQLFKDIASITGYHAVNIWPHLNGFSGYDAVEFRVKIY